MINRMMRNPIIPVEWAGFRSSTYELGAAGWEIASQQDIETGGIQFIIKHPKMDCFGVSHYMEIPYRDQHQLPMFINRMKINPTFLNSTTQFQQIDWDKMRVVETEPKYTEIQIKRLEDFRIFNVKEPSEILVDPNSVPDLMKHILKMQSVKQKELREKQRKAVRREIGNMENNLTTITHANIISIV